MESGLSNIDGHFFETFWLFLHHCSCNAAFRQQLYNQQFEKTTSKGNRIKHWTIHKYWLFTTIKVFITKTLHWLGWIKFYFSFELENYQMHHWSNNFVDILGSLIHDPWIPWYGWLYIDKREIFYKLRNELNGCHMWHNPLCIVQCTNVHKMFVYDIWNQFAGMICLLRCKSMNI